MRIHHHWSEAEEAVLREVYPHGGMRSVLARLPHLTPNIVRRKVELLHLRMPNRAPKRKQPSTEWIDAAIRRNYKSGRPCLKVLAKTLGREYGWVKWRAAVLGLCRTKGKLWTAAEDALLERCLDKSMSITAIYKRFMRAGTKRSLSAIASRIEGRGLLFNREFWTANDVARALAVDSHEVARWLESGKLRGTRGPGPSATTAPADPRRLLWQVKPGEVRRFMIANPECWDHRKMRREVLIDLLAGGDSGLSTGVWGVAS